MEKKLEEQRQLQKKEEKDVEEVKNQIQEMIQAKMKIDLMQKMNKFGKIKKEQQPGKPNPFAALMANK